MTVCDVYEDLRQGRSIAYTTGMSVVRYLAACDVRPKVTDEQVAPGILDALVDRTMGGNAGSCPGSARPWGLPPGGVRG